MKHAFIAGALCLVATAVGAESAVPEKAAVCATCHGEAGAKPIAPDYPILAGQYSNYLAHALHDYRAGKRKNPLMTPQAAQLSDADIKALARYFSEQQGPLYTPRIPEHKAK